MPTRGFDADDFELLERLGEANRVEVDADTAERADAAWERVEAVLRDAVVRTEAPGLSIDVWPWREGSNTNGFVWARLKRPDARSFATHLGVFLAPGDCNISLDLEKDRIEEGSSRESLEDVLDFYGDTGRPVLGGVEDPDIRIWTDADNVLELEEFLDEDLATFMDRNQDSEHPWPKLGYRLPAERLASAPDEQARLFGSRLESLVPVYDALVRSVGTS